MIIRLLDEAVHDGARRKVACKLLGLDPTTIQRWRKSGSAGDRRAGPLTKPSNAICPEMIARILELVNSPEFRDKSPKQIVPLLADRGIYLASESTLYRILRKAEQLKHRETSKEPAERYRPDELIADGANQVWSWDITYLHTQTKGAFYYLYMTLDVWSRKIVGFEVHDHESSDLAAAMISTICSKEGIAKGQLSLHSDNGGPMKGATMLVKLQDLGVAASFSRPCVSNDNPYSESAFRTAKYRPDFPFKPFESIEHAREWVENFVQWYNHEHLHSSISFVTPSDRHTGKDIELLEKRDQVYKKAKAEHPERWTGGTRDWSHTKTVILNPALAKEEQASA